MSSGAQAGMIKAHFIGKGFSCLDLNPEDWFFIIPSINGTPDKLTRRDLYHIIRGNTSIPQVAH